MYLTGKPTDTYEQLAARLAQLTNALLDGFPLDQETLTLEGVDDLYQHFDRNHIFLVVDGMIHLTNDGQNVVSFDEGDLVGFTRAFDFPCPTLKADEFVELKAIDRDSFLRHVYSDKRRQHYWSHYLLCQNSLLLNQMAELSKGQQRPTAGF